MANLRKGVPAGWQWRDGRPRWIPSPALRAAGWKGLDLKDPKGAWLARGASIDAAGAIVEGVGAWRAGGVVAAALAPCAPSGACQTPGAGLPRPAGDRRSIGFLLDGYLGDKAKAIEPSEEFRAYKNKGDRRSKLSRMVDVLAGYVVQPPADAKPAELEAYREARDQVRLMSIDVLEPPEFEDTPDLETASGPLYALYWKLFRQVGAPMAHGVMADISAWLSWCVKRRAIRQNFAKLVDRETPPGRIRVGTWEELRAMIWAAEALGLPSIADSIILAVDLSWSQVDRLKLKWPQINTEGRVKGRRQKTGITGETPLLKGLGVPRVAAIRQRQKDLYGETVHPTHVLVCELTGRPWESTHYRHKYAEVRVLAASKVPSVATLQDLDLRDTAITVAYAAGLKPEEIRTRSLHSMKRIAEVLQKHYVELGQETADAGALKLNDYLAKRGIKL